MIDSVVRKILKEEFYSKMSLNENVKVSDKLRYHLTNKISLSENVYRIYSDSFFDLINEVRELYKKELITLNKFDRELIESDLGKKVKLLNGQVVYLEVPIKDYDFLTEAEYQGRKVQLGKIIQGDVKKFKVYVKNENGKVVKVNFGFGGKSAKGKIMRIKKNNPERRKSFRARHNCDNPGPKWKAR